MSRLLFLTLFALSAFAQDLKITGGIADHQVLQRNAEERADVSLSGTADKKFNNKYVEARITQKGAPVPGYDWTPMSRIRNDQWTGEFKGLPTGGPYRVEARISGNSGATAVEEVLVGDLWILAGQSNMQGVGDLIDVQAPQPLVHSFDMADQWGIAREPLHTLVSAADRVHWPLNQKKEAERYTGERLARYMDSRTKGAGLGLPFAVEMLRRTGVPIGLVPCAHGGTSMDQWDPALKDKGGDSLYGSTLRRFRAVGGKVKGILWYQGESDANPKAAPLFAAKFERLVQSFRDDFGQPEMPFYYVQIGRHVSNTNVAEWNAVQDAQLRAESRIPKSGMIASIDAALDDGIHVSTQDLKRLGRRMANLATRDLFPSNKEYGQMKRGPRPVSAKFENGMVRVTFAEVNGQLMSEGRLNGFTIHGPTGEVAPIIYKQRFDPADPNTVVLHVGGKLPEKATVWYGFGKDPYCNLRDTADMGAPVFAALEIK